MIRLAAILAFLVLAGCKPPPAPAPTSQPAGEPPKALIVVVPGLGNPDTGPLCDKLAAEFPAVSVVNFGSGQNSYLADVKTYVLANPHGKLITIGFSYGTSKVNDQIGDFGPVALDAKLDPVPEKLFARYTITPNVAHTIVITGDFSGMFRAGIDGQFDEFKVHTDHVHIPSDPRTWAILIPAVREAMQ